MAERQFSNKSFTHHLLSIPSAPGVLPSSAAAMFLNLPDKFELIHLDKGGIRIAKDAEEEEFCLAYACNHLAKDGWEAVNLNSRRVLLRRALNR